MRLPTVIQLVIVTYVELFKLQISVSASRSVSRHANESTGYLTRMKRCLDLRLHAS